MAEMGWTARVAAAAGIAAGTGAAQLGLGYGLGVVVWPVTDTPDDSIWLGSLGWATWITASATVLGAVLASRLAGGAPRRVTGSGPGRITGPWRLALAAAAAIGALVAVALIALPARAAVREDTFSPQVIAAGYALLGVLLGLVVAYWAVVSRPVAANLIVTGAWLWALAISAVVVDLTVHRSSATYLTSWQFAGGADHLYGTIFWPSAVLTLAAAFLIGVFAVVPAVRRGHRGTGAATSGAVGPLLVAAAFFALAPQLTGDLGPLESAYLIAPYAVLAGLAGSAITVAFAQAAATRRATATRVPRALPAAPRPDPAPDTTAGIAPPARGRLSRADRKRSAALAKAAPKSKRIVEDPDSDRRTTGQGRAPTREQDETARTARGPRPRANSDDGRATASDDDRGTASDDDRGTASDHGPSAAPGSEPRTESGGGRENGAATSAAAPGLAAIPAADPATFPAVAPEPKRRAFWGRRQPKLAAPDSGESEAASSFTEAETDSTAPKSSPAAPGAVPPDPIDPRSAKSGPTPNPRRPAADRGPVSPASSSRGASPAAAPKTPSAQPAGTSPGQPANPGSGQPTKAAPGRPAGPAPAQATPGQPTKATPDQLAKVAPGQPTKAAPGQPAKAIPAPAAGATPAPARPAKTTPAPTRTNGPGTGPAPAARAEQPDVTDPEIAAAARPRPRAKKAPASPPEAAKSSPSTITPPPANPTIAQINPKTD